MTGDSQFTPAQLAQLRATPPGVADALRRFARINREASLGFEAAATQVGDPALAQVFRRVAEVRRGHLDELQPLLEACGEDPEPNGGVMAAMHRWWLDLRAWLTGGDPYAVLAEVEFGEDAIKATYEELAAEIEGTFVGATLDRQVRAIRELIATQFAEVRKTHDRMRDLRDSRA